MTWIGYTQKAVTVTVLAFASVCLAQTSAAPAAPASSGTYSIESEIFAYKAVRANSVAISDEVAALLGITIDPKTRVGTGSGQTAGIVLVPSSSTALPSFQLWRSHMLIVQTFIQQSDTLLQGGSGCPATPAPVPTPTSFSAYTTAIGEGVTALQGILSLFSHSQSVNEFTGTVQDQALMTAVARDLRKRNISVLTPDIISPWSIAQSDVAGKKFPFIALLATLISRHSALQSTYLCNQIAITAGSQVQQAEAAREADFAKLADPSVTTTVKQQPILSDIRSLKSELDFLRLRIGLSEDDLKAINSDEDKITTQGRIVAALTATQQAKADANKAIHSLDVDISNHEIAALIKLNLQAAKAQSLISGIESYLSGLTGGSVNLAPASASSAGSPSTPGTTTAGSTTPGAASTPAGPSTSPASPTPSAASGTAPIVTVLQTDGLAAKMGFSVDSTDNSLKFDSTKWRILWVKSMESGGAILTETMILGSHPHFGGGAVSGYALFNLDGGLVCSGNTASYGGYVLADDFTKESNVNKDAVVMLKLDDACPALNP